MKKIFAILTTCLLLASCAQFTELQPKGMNLLSTVDELELLLNAELEGPTSDMKRMCGDMISYANIPNELASPTPSRYTIMLTWDESKIETFNDLTASDGDYTSMYGFIGRVANPILSRIADATGDETKKNQLRAEAYTLRAWAMYILVNKFAAAYNPSTAANTPGIPMLLEDWDISEPTEIATVAAVYDQIIADCDAAIALNALPLNNINRMRMSKACPYAVKAMAHADSVINVVRAIDGVQAALPVVEDQALAVMADYQMPVRMRGVTDDYNRYNAMNELMVEGEFMLHDGVSSYMVPGVGPAIQLRATSELLHMVKLFVPRRQGSVNMANPMTAFRADSLFVAGVFQLQQNNYDARVIFVPIDVAKGLLDYTTEATQVEVFVTDSTATPAVMQRIVTALGPSYAVKDRLMQQDAAYRLVNVEKWMAFLLLAFILVIATFNVIGTLSLLIIEKRESIDVMRSLGADDRLITRIFIAEGWLITLVGTVLGVAIGLLLCYGQQRFGWITLSGDPANMIVHAYPVAVQWSDVLLTLGAVLVVGMLTSLVTAIIVRGNTRS